jgi:uncharacterized protein (DUF1697 family)
MRYAILLRGVNAGGNHRVPKGEFQRVLEGIGFRDVTVYINSGNAVCTSDKMVDAEEVQTTLENHFGFSIPTLVLSGEKVKAIAAAIPDDWTNDAPKPDKSGQKSDVLYLFDEINTPDILVRLGHNVDGAVITNITRANQSKGSLQKVISTGLYAHMTVRNVNTARKLAELIG